jgi:hypothetical protein
LAIDALVDERQHEFRIQRVGQDGVVGSPRLRRDPTGRGDDDVLPIVEDSVRVNTGHGEMGGSCGIAAAVLLF